MITLIIAKLKKKRHQEIGFLKIEVREIQISSESPSTILIVYTYIVVF